MMDAHSSIIVPKKYKNQIDMIWANLLKQKGHNILYGSDEKWFAISISVMALILWPVQRRATDFLIPSLAGFKIAVSIKNTQ
ncbi:hypothetical protein [Desulfobacula sp.]|uniref:hypothetical protein n=1 Tax=Desulfobacula sp. TaxID=2593537 RepID=UPI002614FF60|nr:hypothetical protein [Desulfobacula sp.]